MTGNSSVLLTYVFPTVGCLISLLTFSSSFVAVLQVRRTKRLGASLASAYSVLHIQLKQAAGRHKTVLKSGFLVMHVVTGIEPHTVHWHSALN